MATLKMGSTTMLTESSGALTVNASNPTVTLGSNATFPAGHVIQTTINTHGTTNTNLVSVSDWTDTVITGSITTSSATNSVIMHYSFSFYHNNQSSDFGAGFRVKRVHSGGTG